MNDSFKNNKEMTEGMLAALSAGVVARYDELIVNGPLSIYFSLVEGGFFDAAQALTPQIKENVCLFSDKIEESFLDSDYYKSVEASVDNITGVLNEVKALIANASPVPAEVDESINDKEVAGSPV